MKCFEDIYFWSGIMRDHGEFQLLTLSYREREAISKARYFKDTFISIRKAAEKMLKAPCKQEDCDKFIKQVLPVLNNFIEFKKELIKKLMTCDIEIGLSPTFIDHMVNEAYEFESDMKLNLDKKPMDPTLKNIKLHLIWLPDAAGHAAGIIGNLDYVETKWIEKANKFKEKFGHLFIKTSELSLLLQRTCLENGALDLLNEEVNEIIEEFIDYLNEVKVLRQKCKLLGTLPPLMADHMIREEQYYLAKVQDLYSKC